MISESAKLSVLGPLFQDPAISEIMVNNYKKIFVEKNGKILSTKLHFSDEQSLQQFLYSLAKDCDRELSTDKPFFDGYLADGSRINAVIPPMAPHGAILTIRRFQHAFHTLSNLIKLGSLNDKCALFLDAAIKARLNIIVSGGTGTGKTTFLNALSSLIPAEERLVTIEDTAELKLRHPNWVRLESVHSGRAKVTIRQCLINALRMRPDRIIVGECRNDETFEMLQAMNTGHDGSLTTIHANSPRDCLGRIESLVALSGVEFPLQALRQQVASAVDIIVQLKRARTGERYISEVLELTGMEQNMITTQPIFARDKNKQLSTTGLAPLLVERFIECGINLPANFFEPTSKVTFHPEPDPVD